MPAARTTRLRPPTRRSAQATSSLTKHHDARHSTARTNSATSSIPDAKKSEKAPQSLRCLSQQNLTALSCDTISVVGRFESQSSLGCGCCCSAVAPDGTVWTGEPDGRIIISLAPSGLEVRCIIDVNRTAAALVMASVNGCMWVAFSDGLIRVFDPVTLAVLHESKQHTAAVHALYAVDRYVYTGGADWKIYQWEAADMRFCRLYHGHHNTVRCINAYTDRETGHRLLVSGSDDGTLKVWATSAAKDSPYGERDGGCIATMEGQGRGILSLLVLEDTAELWVGNEDTVLRVWNLSSMAITAVLTTHCTPVVTLRRVGETVWSGSKDGMLVITDRFTKEVLHQAAQPPSSFSGSGHPYYGMSILPVTRSVVYNVWATAPDGSWQCWKYTCPDGGAPLVGDSAEPLDGPHPLRASLPPSASSSKRRSSKSRRSTATSPNANNRSAVSSTHTEATSHDEELRASVAQTRRHIVEFLVESAEGSHHGTGSLGGSRDDRSPAVPDDTDVPLDAIEASIRGDNTAAEEQQTSSTKGSAMKDLSGSTVAAEAHRTDWTRTTVAAATDVNAASKAHEEGGKPPLKSRLTTQRKSKLGGAGLARRKGNVAAPATRPTMQKQHKSTAKSAPGARVVPL